MGGREQHEGSRDVPDGLDGTKFHPECVDIVEIASLSSSRSDHTLPFAFSGIIDSSALAGQKNFHAAQEIAMRAYIADHITEFQTEGIEDDDAADDPSGAGDLTACLSPKSPVHTKTIPEPSGPTSGGTPAEVAHQRKVELEGTFLQVGLDSLGSGALQIIKGFWAILEAAWTGLGAQGLLALVIALLVVSKWVATSRSFRDILGTDISLPAHLPSASGHSFLSRAPKVRRVHRRGGFTKLAGVPRLRRLPQHP